MMALARMVFTPTLLTLTLVSGCMPGAVPGTGSGGDDDDDPADTCEGPLGPPRDPAGFEACCQDQLDSEAHCLPGSMVPGEFQGYTDTCTSSGGAGFCVPDKFIATGGVYTPPSCTSLDMAPGVCLSTCIKDVKPYAGILPTDNCDPGEVCAPCISPLDGTDTGACAIAGTCVNPDDPPAPPPVDDGDDPTTCVHEGDPVVDPSALPPCAADAHCLQTALVPAELQGRLGPCPTDATKSCVPDIFLTSGGDFLLPTCRSLVDAEGRCVSLSLPEVAAQETLLPQSTCTAAERCVPCYDPTNGADTGACRISCDLGPTEPPVTLATCCDGRATCVPNSAVPEEMQSNLEEAECEDVEAGAYLCVPNEFVAGDYTPPACTADSFLLGEYTGVCLSDCLDFGIQGIALSGGDCADGEKCAPCENPLTGEPTGAPGCAP